MYCDAARAAARWNWMFVSWTRISPKHRISTIPSQRMRRPMVSAPSSDPAEAARTAVVGVVAPVRVVGATVVVVVSGAVVVATAPVVVVAEVGPVVVVELAGGAELGGGMVGSTPLGPVPPPLGAPPGPPAAGSRTPA